MQQQPHRASLHAAAVTGWLGAVAVRVSGVAWLPWSVSASPHAALMTACAPCNACFLQGEAGRGSPNFLHGPRLPAVPGAPHARARGTPGVGRAAGHAANLTCTCRLAIISSCLMVRAHGCCTRSCRRMPTRQCPVPFALQRGKFQQYWPGREVAVASIVAATSLNALAYNLVRPGGLVQ